MITRAKKQEVVKEAEELLGKQTVLFFTKFAGVGVNKLQALRRELRSIGAEFKVIRKTLLQLALKQKNIGANIVDMPGEVGVIFGYKSEVDPAKAAVKFGKENTTFQIISGFLNGNLMTAQQAVALSKLPTKEQLLGQLVGVLQAPIGNFQGVLSGNIRGLTTVLSEISKK